MTSARERHANDPSTRGEPLEPEHLTDLGNARRLVRLFGNDVRYVPPLKKWLLWDMTRWQPDDTGGIVRLAKVVVAGIYSEAGYELQDARRDALGKHAVRSESVRALQAMVTLAQTEAGVPVVPEQLDVDPWLLNCANGTLELRSGTLRPPQRNDLITKIIPVAYEAGAPCPTWLAFLDRILGGRENLIRFVQRAIGYALRAHDRASALHPLGCGRQRKVHLHRRPDADPRRLRPPRWTPARSSPEKGRAWPRRTTSPPSPASASPPRWNLTWGAGWPRRL